MYYGTAFIWLWQYLSPHLVFVTWSWTISWQWMHQCVIHVFAMLQCCSWQTHDRGETVLWQDDRLYLSSDNFNNEKRHSMFPLLLHSNNCHQALCSLNWQMKFYLKNYIFGWWVKIWNLHLLVGEPGILVWCIYHSYCSVLWQHSSLAPALSSLSQWSAPTHIRK